MWSPEAGVESAWEFLGSRAAWGHMLLGASASAPAWWLCRLSPGGGEIKWRVVRALPLRTSVSPVWASWLGFLSSRNWAFLLGAFALLSSQTWPVGRGDLRLALPRTWVSAPQFTDEKTEAHSYGQG